MNPKVKYILIFIVVVIVIIFLMPTHPKNGDWYQEIESEQKVKIIAVGDGSKLLDMFTTTAEQSKNSFDYEFITLSLYPENHITEILQLDVMRLGPHNWDQSYLNRASPYSNETSVLYKRGDNYKYTLQTHEYFTKNFSRIETN
jgi:hypothetical protein